MEAPQRELWKTDRCYNADFITGPGKSSLAILVVLTSLNYNEKSLVD